MYVYPKLNSETDAVAVKSFMTSDKMEAKWSHVDGKSVLILAMAEVDKTGASYYGKTQVCSFEVQQLPGKPSHQHNYIFSAVLRQRRRRHCHGSFGKRWPHLLV